MLSTTSTVLATLVAYVAASPILGTRTVTQLTLDAFNEAQQRDDTAIRAFTNVQIKTSDGRCLFVDELSGDFRANLTPIQIADCGTGAGQGWDVLTSGKHNNVANSVLVVSTLTQACFNFDPRRAAGNQVLLFSCGGRADGSGQVTNSQLFSFSGGSGPLSFSPENQPGSCFAVKGNVLDIAPCASGDSTQSFTFGGEAVAGSGGATSIAIQTPTQTSTQTGLTTTTKKCSAVQTIKSSTTTAAATALATSTPITTTTDVPAAAITTTIATNIAAGGIPNPTDAVPVSRAGGTLVPSAVAESHQRDDTATRAFTSVSIQAPNGQCLFVDPTAGDFRENLIPVSLVTCAGTPNEKFDVITAGKHNNAQNAALIVSSLTQGCISHDGRRAAGDTVTIFSCGGRAAGEGETSTGQLIPFTGGTSLVFAPLDAANATCIVPGNGRLDSAPCTNDATQLFTINA